MLTAAEIAKLTPEARTAAFDQLAATIFNTQPEICAALDVSRRTLQNWRAARDVPIMALLAIQSCATSPTQPSAILQDMRAVAAQLEAACDAMAQSARLIAGIARRLPDPS